MSPPATSPPARPPVAVVPFMKDTFSVFGRYALAFFMASVIPLIMSMVLDRLAYGVPYNPDFALLHWLAQYVYIIVPKAIFIGACLRILANGGRLPSPLGLSFGLLERRIVYVLWISYAQFRCARMLTNWMYSVEGESLAGLLYWTNAGLMYLLWGANLLAFSYFADRSNRCIVTAMVKSWRMTRGSIVRLSFMFAMMAYLYQFWLEPTWLKPFIPNASYAERVMWGVHFYFHSATVAVMSHLAFKHFHPDDEPVPATSSRKS